MRSSSSGYVPFGDELRERYRLADAFLHVSLTEGLPQVLFEAAAAGLPIVATDVGGVAEALGSERGIVVPPGDAGAAARALLALRDESLRSRLASAALEYARTRTLEQQVGEILRFFNSSLEPTRGAHRSSSFSARVSVVIPALNEAASIERCVRSVLAQRAGSARADRRRRRIDRRDTGACPLGRRARARQSRPDHPGRAQPRSRRRHR